MLAAQMPFWHRIQPTQRPPACRFEQLALQYDSDEIGELDEMEGNGEMEGTVSVDQFQDVLDDFLDNHRTADHAHEAGFQYETAAAHAGDQHQDPEAAAAVAKVSKSLLGNGFSRAAGPLVLSGMA